MKNMGISSCNFIMQSCATNFMDALNKPKLKNNLVTIIPRQQTN